MTPSIAIIGAGPAGLTLASLLHRNSIRYTLFDLRSKPSSSNINIPSGSLDLHVESGLKALQACGLSSNISSLPSCCSENLLLADKSGTIKYSDDGHDGTRPEIPRNTLNDLLLSSIPEDSVKWEHKLLSISQSPDQRWKLAFQDQEEQSFDLVVGADGAWSKVRAVVTDVKPHFSGVNCITLTIPKITTKYPELAKMVGRGSYYAAGEKKAVMSQRGSLDSARMYLMISSDSKSYLSDTGLDSMGAVELKEKLLNDPKLFGSWGTKVRELIGTGCDEEIGKEISAKPLYMLPLGHTWDHVPGVTLLGDAAHLMTPFAGEGVNAAMLDALELAEGIISAVKKGSLSLSDTVEEYEIKMFPRATEIKEESWQNLQVIFQDDAPDGFVKIMLSHGPPPEQ